MHVLFFKPLRVVLPVLLAACAHASAPPSAALSLYPIHIHTRSFLHEKFTIEHSRAELISDSTRWEGRDDLAPAERDYAYGTHSILDKELLQLNQDADASATLTTIRIWTRTLSDGREEVVMPPGTRISARVTPGDSKCRYTVNDKPASSKAATELALIAKLILPDHKEPSDAIFGSDRPRRIGETWPINASAYAKFARQRLGRSIRPADIKGTMTFSGVETINGIACLRLVEKLTLQNYLPARKSTPTSAPSTRHSAPAASTTASSTQRGGTSLPTVPSSARDDPTFIPGTDVIHATRWIPVDGCGEPQRFSFSSEIRYTVAGAVHKHRYIQDVTIRYASEARITSFSHPTTMPASTVPAESTSQPGPPKKHSRDQ
jgi:hypothetical protein